MAVVTVGDSRSASASAFLGAGWEVSRGGVGGNACQIKRRNHQDFILKMWFWDLLELIRDRI